MIQIEHLQKVYRKRGKRVGLLEADFTLQDGCIVGILGENGAGKTTLMRAMAGLVAGTKGKTLFDGAPALACYAQISYITGEGSYFPSFTVGEYGEYLDALHPAFDAKRYAKFLEFFSLDPRDSIAKMSTGQRARVELAAGFSKRVKYYFMDEPFLGKDVFTRKDFLKLMSAVLDGSETVLICTHYVDEIEQFLDRAIVMHEGRVARDIELEILHQSGSTLVECMAEASGYDPKRYLEFEETL